MIRVGRRKYPRGKCMDPCYPNFKPIICMTKSTAYGDLSPYALTDDKGYNLENVWQFSKVYESVPKSRQVYSNYDPRVIWDHPAEDHVVDGVVNEKYWKWREKGMKVPDAIRYPVGFYHRHKCLYSLQDIGDGYYLAHDYIDARKAIYLPKYLQSVQDKPKFLGLKSMLEKGINLLIIEVDGPHQESMFYYEEKYDVNDDFIDQDTVLATEYNLNILLNDDKHPFGHGYCLAWALKNYELK